MNHSAADHDLLSRLNALKKSTVDLDQSKPTVSSVAQSNPIDPAPARALHADLLDRFKTLTGGANPNKDSADHPAQADVDGAEKHDDDKTVEELLADLGPAEQWNVHKSEHDEVADLLRAADAALKTNPKLEKIPGDDEAGKANEDATQPGPARLAAVDVSVFQQEPDSDNEIEPKQTKEQLRDGVNDEADDVLRRLMDEVKYERKHQGPDDDDNSARHASDSDGEGKTLPDPSFDLPSAPSKSLPAINNDATSQKDEDLAARFASLSFPSSLPSVPTSFISSAGATKSNSKADDEDIDTWCIICNDDATLSCKGCDGDLYCTNCWMEGHRGEDAGFEERRHKAVQYVRGKKKKMKGRRVAMGA